MWWAKGSMAAAIVLLLLVPSASRATVIVYGLSIEYSGATPPEGSTPWLTATFDDGGTQGSVDLTLDTTNLTQKEFVFEWIFNLDPALSPDDLVFSEPTKTGSFADPTINTGVDAFKADGDGYFDIQVVFEASDGSPTRFGEGDAVVYTITGIPTLTATSFDYFSAPGGDVGVFPTAAHVGGIGLGGKDSGWISVVEPTSFVALMLGGLALLRRRR